MNRGVPGGTEINKNHFRVDDPIEFLDSYVQAQTSEANHIEVGRIAVWSVGAPAIAVGATVVAVIIFGS